MKTLFLLFLSLNLTAQILPGSIEIKGSPFLKQPKSSLSSEAGLDDDNQGFESRPNAMKVDFTLDPGPDILGNITSSKELCQANIFRYSVYMHVIGAPPGFQLKARTFSGSGNRFPKNALYDRLPVQPLGPRDIYPENGGAYILLPNNPGNAVKVCEFVGCREDIEFQFLIIPTQEINADLGQVQVYYTIVGTIL